MPTRQPIPDCIKGLAIVLMVYGHTTYVGTFVQFQNQMKELIYTFHMPLFLIISGFFFNRKNELYNAVKRLISRIVRPYLIFISLYLLGLIVVQGTSIPTSNPPPTSVVDFLTIVFLHPIGGYWFLHSLILIQLCFQLAHLFVAREKLDTAVSLIVALLLLAMATNRGFLGPGIALYFLIGMLISRIGTVLPSSLSTGVVLTVLIFMFERDSVFQFSFMQVVWCLSIMIVLSGVGQYLQRTVFVSAFAWLGRNTLIILVLHPIFTVLLKPSSHFLLNLDKTGLVYSATVVFTAVSGSILAAFLSDRIRLSRYLFGVGSIYSALARDAKDKGSL